MADPAPPLAQDPQPEPSAAERTKLLAEFLQKTYWDGANLVFKGTAFYIAILAAFVGYVVSQRVQTRVAELTLYSGMATSMLALTVAIISGRTIFGCVQMLEKLMLRQVTEGSDDLALRSIFSRWRNTIWSFGICGTLLVAIFVFGMVVLKGSMVQSLPAPQSSKQVKQPATSVQP